MGNTWVGFLLRKRGNVSRKIADEKKNGKKYARSNTASRLI